MSVLCSAFLIQAHCELPLISAVTNQLTTSHPKQYHPELESFFGWINLMYICVYIASPMQNILKCVNVNPLAAISSVLRKSKTHLPSLCKAKYFSSQLFGGKKNKGFSCFILLSINCFDFLDSVSSSPESVFRQRRLLLIETNAKITIDLRAAILGHKTINRITNAMQRLNTAAGLGELRGGRSLHAIKSILTCTIAGEARRIQGCTVHASVHKQKVSAQES